VLIEIQKKKTFSNMNSRNIKLVFIFVELMTIGLFQNIHNF